eukprot:CAMPEP_0118655472 /NCGR_PEP_ID=MMETSP0785-20121206/12946_1 /TAXON_ID=91992 /ORGANISM="Bolidomonas pacifica, Strain CCMP 1866" /LENGTH=53 /DNA_ID=CAMNT_0006548211 /DNA_START=210 /DNA_END=368 /DNA_ORIENTATION=-
MSSEDLFFFIASCSLSSDLPSSSLVPLLAAFMTAILNLFAILATSPLPPTPLF